MTSFDESPTFSHIRLLLYIQGEDNNWSSLQANNKRIMTPLEWRQYTKVRGLTPFTMNSMPPQTLYNITMTKMCGATTGKDSWVLSSDANTSNQNTA